MDLIKALWRGDIPLIKTYWVYACLGLLLLKIPLIIVEEFPLPPSALADAFLFLYTVFAFLYWAFMSVALWRSSSKYGGSFWWAGLARLFVVLGVLKTLVEVGKAFKD